MKKRVLAFFLAVMMVSSAICPQVYAQGAGEEFVESAEFSGLGEAVSEPAPLSGTTESGLQYSESGDQTIEITGCSSEATEIIIPEEIDGKAVTSIGGYAFSGCSSLISIEIPKSVTGIGESAFFGCSGLTGIELPGSVTSIGDRAFWGCSGLTSIELPEGVTSIGDHAFYNCSNLTSIKITGSVTSIGKYAFEGCRSLTGIELPGSVTSIGESAFHDCSNLTSIELPESVTSIETGVFHNCSSLASIKISGNVTSIGNGAFYNCSNLASIELPGSVASIGKSAFGECRSLTNIKIPEGVTSIEDYAFSECSGLTGIELPGSVTSIGEYAFTWCSSLRSIEIPGNVTSIGENAFEGCYNLESIEIPESVTIIENSVFSGCRSLAGIRIPGNVTTIKGGAFSGCSSLTGIELPGSVTSIGDWAFSDCSGLESIIVDSSNTRYTSGDGNHCIIERATNTLIVGCKNTTIPEGVTIIEGGAFYGCSSLTGIELPGSVTIIGAYAFNGCSGLTSVEIPGSVTTIWESAFNGCSSLTSIRIPGTVTTIGDDAFGECDNLVIKCYKDAYVYQYASDEGIPFELLGDLEEYTITYHLNGGENNSANPKTYTAQTETITLENPTRSGYTFVGWYEDAEFTTQVTQIANGSVGNITLYAKWSCNHASTEVRGQKAATCTQAGDEGDTYCKTCGTLVKAGKSIPAFGHSYTGKVTKEPTLTANGIKTYTCGKCDATYTEEIPKLAVKYTVKFHGNGSTSGTMKSLTGCGYGNTYTLAANKFKRTGYTFAGWNTKKNGKGKSYKNKAQIKNLTSEDGKTITLYAQWKKTKYSITYHLNKGKNNRKNPKSYTVTTSTIKLKAPTRKGYSFAGWYTNKKYTKKVTQIKKGSTGKVVLYAKWKKK